MTATNEYFAGLFDGEGCVGIYRIHANAGRYQLFVQLGMCDWPPITALKSRFGGKIVYGSKPKTRGYILWTIRGARAEPFLRAILPHSLVKAPQIELALEFLNTLVPPSVGNAISADVAATRDRINEQMRALKRTPVIHVA